MAFISFFFVVFFFIEFLVVFRALSSKYLTVMGGLSISFVAQEFLLFFSFLCSGSRLVVLCIIVRSHTKYIFTIPCLVCLLACFFLAGHLVCEFAFSGWVLLLLLSLLDINRGFGVAYGMHAMGV